MSQTHDDLRATAESIAADAERLKEVEEATVGTEASAPELLELNAQSEQLVDEIRAKAALQSALVAETVSGS